MPSYAQTPLRFPPRSHPSPFSPLPRCPPSTPPFRCLARLAHSLRPCPSLATQRAVDELETAELVQAENAERGAHAQAKEWRSKAAACRKRVRAVRLQKAVAAEERRVEQERVMAEASGWGKAARDAYRVAAKAARGAQRAATEQAMELDSDVRLRERERRKQVRLCACACAERERAPSQLARTVSL